MGKRAVIIVLDGVGAGELPDASNYGDSGSNTLANTAHAVGGLQLPNFQRLGLGNILPIEGVTPAKSPEASYGKMAERSAGKDTTTGHWEIAGVILQKPFPTYPHGFPPEIISAFEQRIGRKTIGNVPASGTEIIKELGEEHLKTGSPIIYTSADSVLQIAAHLDVIPLDELYRICSIARELLQGPHAVGRVIARPFTGPVGEFTRTPDRKDFSLLPPQKTVLDQAKAAGMDVLAVGKISQIFAGSGITREITAHGNPEAIQATLQALQESFSGILMINLVDFDMLYGHRNNPQGFAQALQEVDSALSDILSLILPDDLLLITADHGCDPTTPSTDHSREYVPLLAYRPKVRGASLGIRSSFTDLGATVADYLQLPSLLDGNSFLSRLTP